MSNPKKESKEPTPSGGSTPEERFRSAIRVYLYVPDGSDAEAEAETRARAAEEELDDYTVANIAASEMLRYYANHHR